MKENQKAHLTKWSPAYIIAAVLTGGGGTAALTDNLPVTHAQFVEHENGMHQVAGNAIEEINEVLGGIRLEQTREQLKQAYSDKCRANGAALEYITKEIDRLEDIYHVLTERDYDPPPCLDS